ncbi:hypothetical protein IZY60_11405 [Lutibacter sp. B2]|nr:hypothetical protein [Lutibacter sp. B2]
MANKKYLKAISVILIVGMILAGCQFEEKINANDTKVASDTKTTLEEVKELTDMFGNENSDTVIINTQGGPMTKLETDEFKEIVSNFNTEGLLMVNVHQYQTINPSKFMNDEISFEEAIQYDKESIEILYKIIKYYKNQNKKVYVLGISFGAFMTQELIAEKGIDVADKYLIMVGRLDMNESFWKGFSEGKDGYFKNGVEPMLIDNKNVEQKNMFKLASGLGQNRYTEKLKKYDLAKITYVYGKADEAVGKLTDEEVAFLKSKNANVIAGEGNHCVAAMGCIVEGAKTAFGID